MNKAVYILLLTVVLNCSFVFGQGKDNKVRLYTSLAREEIFIADTTCTVINYSTIVYAGKRSEMKKRLSSMTENLSDFADGFECDALSEEQIYDICRQLGQDSLYVSFTQKLYLTDSAGNIRSSSPIWPSNSITVKLQDNVSIDEFIKDHNIKYNKVKTWEQNEYVVYLCGAMDKSIELCNRLNKDTRIEYAIPNFGFFIEDD
ncbi:MAG: hypothetical protein IJ250_08175 [Bacteroidales bacterium]|nr:hypothetical protein [Bacteroidales bacterium]